MNERQKPIHPQPKSCEISGCGLLGNGVKRWIIEHNFPAGFQILCMNCQFIKREEDYRKRMIKKHGYF